MKHMAAAKACTGGTMVEIVMKARPVPDRDTAKIDAEILAGVPDRTNKQQAPEPIKPTNRYGSPEGSIKHFVESRATTEEFLKTTTDLRAHAVDSPIGGEWDGYEVVLLIAAHSARHTNEILGVKAEPNLPKKVRRP